VIEVTALVLIVIGGAALGAWAFGVERRLALLEDTMRSPVAQTTVEDRFRTLSD
jgi:hypothetical protein